MSENTIQVGALAHCQGIFRDRTGVLRDPSNVTCTVRTPAGVETTYTYGTDVALVKDSTGTYHVEASITAAGRWFYRFRGTGSYQGSRETHFDVPLPRVT